MRVSDAVERDPTVDVRHVGGRPLAERQAALVAALVAGASDPPGFDPARLAAARRALLRKRAGEAAKHWPVLAASLGPRWSTAFAAHHAGREPGGALRDGWDLARALRAETDRRRRRELARTRGAAGATTGVEPPRPRRSRPPAPTTLWIGSSHGVDERRLRHIRGRPPCLNCRGTRAGTP